MLDYYQISLVRFDQFARYENIQMIFAFLSFIGLFRAKLSEITARTYRAYYTLTLVQKKSSEQ